MAGAVAADAIKTPGTKRFNPVAFANARHLPAGIFSHRAQSFQMRLLTSFFIEQAGCLCFNSVYTATFWISKQESELCHRLWDCLTRYFPVRFHYPYAPMLSVPAIFLLHH
jgi:hypothetical protein